MEFKCWKVKVSRQTEGTGGSTTLPRVPPAGQPLNGNKQPQGAMSLMRSLVPIGLGCPSSVALPQFVSRRLSDFLSIVLPPKNILKLSPPFISALCPLCSLRTLC